MTSSTQVERVLAAAGYRPAGRSVTGATLGVALDGSDRRVELEVLDADEAARSRLRALRDLRHEHLPRVLELVELDAEQVAVFTEHVAGTTLEQVCGARGLLGPGESVTVAIPVAQALDALHRAGLAHGRVSARGIIIEPGGRPVLVTAGSRVAAGGDAREDVRTLLSIVLAHLARDPDPTPGVDAPAPADGGLRSALDDLLRSDGEGDPVTADRVVGRCFRTCAPRPVRLPTPDELRRVALTAGAVGALRRPRTEPARRAARSWAGGTRLALVGGSATVLVVAVVLGLVAVTGGPTPARATAGETSTARARATASSMPTLATPPDPRDAAAAMTERRAELLVAGDAAGLVEVEVVGGPAHRADAAFLEGLGGDRLEGLEVEVENASALPAQGAQEARVQVESTASGYVRRTADGRARATGPAATTSVVLVLHWTDAGWRVWDVVAPPR